jgi:hypothetical protein
MQEAFKHPMEQNDKPSALAVFAPGKPTLIHRQTSRPKQV